VGTPDEIRLALELFDRAFVSGDADALSERFATDARLLLLHSEPIEERPQIHAHWARLFGAYDTGAWRTERIVTDVHGDRAYTLSTYSETLVPRDGGASLVVRGRWSCSFATIRTVSGAWRSR
jgi:ketosteroid isomerase-like protein